MHTRGTGCQHIFLFEKKSDLKIGGLYDNCGRRYGDRMMPIFDQQKFKS
jgi:hypothetical protein